MSTVDEVPALLEEVGKQMSPKEYHKSEKWCRQQERKRERGEEAELPPKEGDASWFNS